VALPDPSVSGIELIELAGQQHGLDYGFGYGGNAVCRLDGVGSEGGDCFSEHPDFWGYWRGDGSGGWTWSSSGAGSTTVEDGDVEGWSWGSGQDGDTHPRPPATSFSSVCASSPKKSGGGGGAAPGPDQQDAATTEGTSENDGPESGSEVAQTDDTGEGEEENDDGSDGKRKPVAGKKKKDQEKNTPGSSPGEASVAPEIADNPTFIRPEEEGPSLVGIVVLVAGILIAAGIGMVARRRSAGG
jgi:hypothetical protein